MRAAFNNLFSRFAKTLAIAQILALSGCSGDCSVAQNLVGDPGCKRLTIRGERTFVGTRASCAGATSSRKLSIRCSPSSGTTSHCDSSINGFPVLSLLVINNSGGNFLDSDGVVYTNCGDLLAALNNGTLTNVLGYFSSDSAAGDSTVSCTDSGGCTLSPQSCYAGWDTSSKVPSGTASIPLTTSVLACTYIDTTALGTADLAVGAWANPIPSYTVSGDLAFTAGWVDAQ